MLFEKYVFYKNQGQSELEDYKGSITQNEERDYEVEKLSDNLMDAFLERGIYKYDYHSYSI